MKCLNYGFIFILALSGVHVLCVSKSIFQNKIYNICSEGQRTYFLGDELLWIMGYGNHYDDFGVSYNINFIIVQGVPHG